VPSRPRPSLSKKPHSAGWPRELSRLFPQARLDEPLSRHTTFRIGGPADAYVVADSLSALRSLLRFARRERVPVFLLGLGSKLLVMDGGVRGVVVRLGGEFCRLDFGRGASVRAGAGAPLARLLGECAGRGLSGAEPLAGIPGSVGGALVMNAGTSEGDIGGLVRSVKVLEARTLRARALPASRLRFGYRSSGLRGRIVLGATLGLRRGSKVDIIERVKKLQEKRRRTQPVRSFTVGSIFKNPPGQSAAKLIQDAGLKGTARGGARISRLHANFIENFKRARASDVLRLAETARREVRRRTGIELELEMRVVGEKKVPRQS